ncbi:MAG: hypothetical protein KGL39_08030 [Patescibacteria group bacterium]|nr:hypothetical protein [Patescibacteria group bacterium]
MADSPQSWIVVLTALANPLSAFVGYVLASLRSERRKDIAQLFERIDLLTGEMADLRSKHASEIAALQGEHQSCRQENASLRKEVEVLRAEIEVLKTAPKP